MTKSVLGTTLIIITLVLFYTCKSDKNTQTKKAEQIYEILNQHRLTYDIDRYSDNPIFDRAEQRITGVHECIKNIVRLITDNRPLPMVFVGFPFKSPNHEKKTIGDLPDMAERRSLHYVQEILNNIKSVYTPGARLTIICDGIPFAEFFGVQKNTILCYEQALKQLASDLPDITLYTSDNFIKEYTFSSLDDINTLIDTFSPTTEEFRALNHTLPAIAQKRVELELDHYAGHKLISNKSLDTILVDFLAREKRLQNYIKEKYPPSKFFRLSAHFNADVSQKIGIKLSPTSCITPYHGVCIEESDGSFSLQFKKNINLEHYELITKNINGIPCPSYKRKIKQ